MSLALEIRNLSKEYRLGSLSHGVLFRDLQSAWARFRGKDDPNSSVFTSKRTENGHFLALNDISFSVKRGEAIGIIGKNGAGKSTLLKILSRVTAPSKGTVSAKGRIASLLEVGTGFHPELTGRENIFLNGAILGMTRSEVRRKLDEIVDFSGIERFIDTPVKRYSSGMYVRLAFAVAAHLEPDILIIDEVLAVGDAEFQSKCIGKMNSISKQNHRTILFVSHNMGAINEICSRAIVLERGRLRLDSTPMEATTFYLSDQKKSLPPTFKAEIKPEIPAQVLEIRVADNNIELGSDVAVTLKYRINNIVTNVTLSILLVWETTPILYSCDTDLNQALIGVREPGIYESTILLPTSILKEGFFQLSTGIGYGMDDLTDPDARVSFEIVNTGIDTTHKSFKKDRYGVLYKELDWRTVKR